MYQTTRLYNIAAMVALLTAIAFAAAAVLSSASAMPLALAAALWLVMAAGLKAGRRWLVYIAFIVAVAGSLVVYATMTTNLWPTLAILALSILLSLILFTLIWTHPKVSH